MNDRYYCRLHSDWQYVTNGWHRTKINYLSTKQRKWIIEQLQGGWTEDIFGYVRFENDDDKKQFLYRWEKI